MESRQVIEKDGNDSDSKLVEKESDRIKIKEKIARFQLVARGGRLA
jgi:hypothetical protein